ncbi:undecaprenyl-phosphate glucose phosphotransferase [Oricola thermophila]|uniref:Undecaprenyl-phosphate glucose phosphotransferase n=1 Tax=Oricola thermophila TaxID=2742145 RepID=A0A6N1VH48_9HYPH|nr:undecaprenyl-phosphate glucose phosphotransferase [Oricola thermophila]QKV18327.1 undecaprenyl-phosphate glucose phosphotransferase [Oricola thermophila]
MKNFDPHSEKASPAPEESDAGDKPPVQESRLDSLVDRIAGELRTDTISPVMVRGWLRIGEFLGLAAIATIIMLAYPQTEANLQYALAITGGSLLYIILAEIADAYELRALRRPLRWFPRIALAWASTFALLALIGFLLKVSGDFSRLWSGSWFIGGMFFLLATRLLLALRIRDWTRSGKLERRAVIVGGGRPAERLIRALEKQRDNDIRICGIFDDRDDERSPPIVAGYPKLGNVEELVAFSRKARIDMLIVSLPLDAEDRVLMMLKKLWVLPVDIRLSAHSNKLRFRHRTYSFIGSVPMLDLADKPIRDWDSVAKRSFDVVFSLLGIVAFSPVMLVTAIAIKLDSRGPVIFRQKRYGFNNDEIWVYKFRSMYTDQCDPSARAMVTKGDPRVTRVGRIIRKTSIDELPQFFNVLRGELSLVGPRPHAITAQAANRLYNEVVDGYFARHRVKPGVTGWAQINGWRGETDTDDKIRKRTEFDLYYIENWSVLFDLKILFLTPIRLFNTDNAY